MDLDPQVATSISNDVPRGLRQRLEEAAKGATDNENPNIGDDFDYM
jgi:hypothetical protein